MEIRSLLLLVVAGLVKVYLVACIVACMGHPLCQLSLLFVAD